MYVHHQTDRWATFDCYGTLIDWHAGIRGVMRRVWPDADPEHLLELYHAVEPLVQAGKHLPYRQVGARTLRAMAAIEGLPLASQDEFALAEMLPEWPAFPEVPAALATLRQRGWRLQPSCRTHRPRPVSIAAQIGVPVDNCITRLRQVRTKPAPGHWQQFFERTGADPHCSCTSPQVCSTISPRLTNSGSPLYGSTVSANRAPYPARPSSPTSASFQPRSSAWCPPILTKQTQPADERNQTSAARRFRELRTGGQHAAPTIAPASVESALIVSLVAHACPRTNSAGCPHGPMQRLLDQRAARRASVERLQRGAQQRIDERPAHPRDDGHGHTSRTATE